MRKLLLAGAIAFLAVPASATTFSADEFTDALGGDFSDVISLSNDNVGTASMAGFSDVIGTLSGECAGTLGVSCNFGIGDTQDSFLFTVASGFELVSVRAGTEGSGPPDLTIGFFLAAANAGFTNLDSAFFDINDGGTVSSGVYGAGTYSFSVRGGTASQEGSFDAFWFVDFETREASTPPPVPLPAGMPLLLAGLGAFAVARRRRKV